VKPVRGPFLCAGNIVHDILVRPVDKLVFDTTVWVEDIRASLGGNGANTSYALGRLGASVRLASITGRDDWGDRVLRILCDAGVDISGVVRSELPTSMTIVLVRPDGARAFFHRPGCATEPFEIPFGSGCSHFHFGNVFALPALRPHAGEMMRAASESGLTTSLDTGWDARGEWRAVIDPALPYTDLLFVNCDEARLLSGEDQPEAAARYFLDRGVESVVVKLGASGSVLYTVHGAISAPAFEVEVVDTTGAGDCFAGGFLAALGRGLPCAEALRFANAVGALSVQALGAVGGVRSFDDTLDWMRLTPPA
jgi:sugar/nucleoside kinase (ribokinase family)